MSNVLMDISLNVDAQHSCIIIILLILLSVYYTLYQKLLTPQTLL